MEEHASVEERDASATATTETIVGIFRTALEGGYSEEAMRAEFECGMSDVAVKVKAYLLRSTTPNARIVEMIVGRIDASSAMHRAAEEIAAEEDKDAAMIAELPNYGLPPLESQLPSVDEPEQDAPPLPVLKRALTPADSPSTQGFRALSAPAGHAVIADEAIRRGTVSSAIRIREVLLRLTKASLLGHITAKEKAAHKSRILLGHDIDAIDTRLCAFAPTIANIRFETERECAVCYDTFEIADGLECSMHVKAVRAMLGATEREIDKFCVSTGADVSQAAGLLVSIAGLDPAVRDQQVDNAILAYNSYSRSCGGGAAATKERREDPRSAAPLAVKIPVEIHFFCKKCVAGHVSTVLEPPVTMQLQHRSLQCGAAGCDRVWQQPQLLGSLLPPLAEQFIDARDETLDQEARFAALQALQQRQLAAAAEADGGSGGAAAKHDARVVDEEVMRAMLQAGPPQYQCRECGNGPVDQMACADLMAHHGEVVNGVAINNGCPFCKCAPKRHIGEWDPWDGSFHPNWINAVESGDGTQMQMWKCASADCSGAPGILPGAACTRCGRQDPEIEEVRLRTTARKYREIFVPLESPILEIRARVAARVAGLPGRRARFAKALDAAATEMTSELCGASAIVAALRVLGLDPFMPASFAYLATRVLEIELAGTSVGDTAWITTPTAWEDQPPRPITSSTGATIFARSSNTSFVDPANPLAFGERVKTTRFGVTGVAVTNANKFVGLRVTSVLAHPSGRPGRGTIVAVPASPSDVVSVAWDDDSFVQWRGRGGGGGGGNRTSTELVSELICIGAASAPLSAGDSDAPLSFVHAVVARSPFVVRFGATQRGSFFDEDRDEVLPEDSVRWLCGAPVPWAAPTRPVDSCIPRNWGRAPGGLGPSRRGIFSLASVPIVLTRTGFASFAAAFPPLDANEASEYEAVQASFEASRRYKDEANPTRGLIRDFVTAMQCDVRTAAFYVSSAPTGDRAATLQAATNEYLDAASRAPPPSYMPDARFSDLYEKEEVGGGGPGGEGGTNASNVTITAARFRVIACACFELQFERGIWTEADAKDLESALNRAADGLSSAFPRHAGQLGNDFQQMREHGPEEVIGPIGRRHVGNHDRNRLLPLRWFASLLESIDVSDATISPESVAEIRGDGFVALRCSRRGAVLADDPCACARPLCDATEDHLFAIERQPGRRVARHHNRSARIAGRWPRVIRAPDPLAPPEDSDSEPGSSFDDPHDHERYGSLASDEAFGFGADAAPAFGAFGFGAAAAPAFGAAPAAAEAFGAAARLGDGGARRSTQERAATLQPTGAAALGRCATSTTTSSDDSMDLELP